jgi:hypothetical protein
MAMLVRVDHRSIDCPLDIVHRQTNRVDKSPPNNRPFEPIEVESTSKVRCNDDAHSNRSVGRTAHVDRHIHIADDVLRRPTDIEVCHKLKRKINRRWRTLVTFDANAWLIENVAIVLVTDGLLVAAAEMIGTSSTGLIFVSHTNRTTITRIATPLCAIDLRQ